jgi:hypothetical protein
MWHRQTISRLLTAGLLLALAFATPADAQRYYGRSGGGGGGFFDNLFGPRTYAPPQRDFGEPSVQVDSSRAPAPKKSDTTPTFSVMVMGDSMADWLGYGLEEAFADSPEIGIVRKPKTNSGLIRYEPRSDLDWWHVARDFLGKEKVDFVVMMLGVNDRQSIRETQAEKKKKEQAAKDAQPAQSGQPAQADQKPDDDEAIAAPEPQRGAGAAAEFRSERWEQIYTRRIDETIAALKSKGVPVLWVGLPPIRGTRSTADVQYLNDLFRARAEAAGVVYVDVWDGFVDEAGQFTYQGPDFEGQTRRLRSGDGVHFTKNGARKLAHYVERELRRFISNRSMPMAMPSGGQQLQGAPNEPAARPVAGPVVPLTGGTPASSEELLGGRSNLPVHSDATATRVLVKGEPVAPAAGRADDFQWPRGGEANAAVEPLSPTAAAARGEPPKPEVKKVAPAVAPAAKEAARDTRKPAGPAAAEKREKPAERTRTTTAAPAPAATSGDLNRPRPTARIQQAPPQQQRQRQPSGGGLFGLFR